ncbi:hypothetical protein ACOCJ4_14730 [Knoellia sp. CPCC 206435]|uniref:hypothetical protein n=1 Tax=Knoellia terrae TaxID=3404797 RepID=UPI003B428E6D
MTTAALTTSRHRLRAALAAAALGSTLLGGCAIFSPVQTNYVYQPADGINATFGDLALRGVLVVADAKDGPGSVVGQLVNNGTEVVDVTIGTGGGAAPTPVSVEPGATLALGGETAVPLASVPAAPGDVVPLQVSTPGSGQNVVTVPVLPALGYYEDSAPSAAPSESAPAPSPSASPSEPASSPSATPSPSASPSS